jgi:hypothetical protein
VSEVYIVIAVATVIAVRMFGDRTISAKQNLIDAQQGVIEEQGRQIVLLQRLVGAHPISDEYQSSS